MSYMSELDAAITEARGVSRIDLVECELSHVKGQRDQLLEACKKANTCASLPDYVKDLLRAAINNAIGVTSAVNLPERDAETQK